MYVCIRDQMAVLQCMELPSYIYVLLLLSFNCRMFCYVSVFLFVFSCSLCLPWRLSPLRRTQSGSCVSFDMHLFVHAVCVILGSSVESHDQGKRRSLLAHSSLLFHILLTKLMMQSSPTFCRKTATST